MRRILETKSSTERAIYDGISGVSQKPFGYCWRTYFTTYNAEIVEGLLQTSVPLKG